MVASRTSNTNPARIPALGVRVLLLLFASILLMVLDHRQNHLNTVRKAVGAAVYPVQLVVDAPFRLWEWIRERTQSRDEMQQELNHLRNERLFTKAELQQLNALKAENARLRDLLEARGRVRDEIRVAKIMAVDANPYRHNIVIDIGEREGAYDGQAIIDAVGVIGQVIKTGLTTSQAMLISDPSHSLPVEVNRNGLRTIANGTGEFDRLDLPFITNNADIQPGDLLVTSGLGGAFPAGYPVAVVETVNRIPQDPFADVTATPAAALDQVREVMLIWSSAETQTEMQTETEPDDE
ncbi:MAG: rod shape-determining protein MreC [Gammaproteobacteria bacterium]|nr:rod shape-determining protein MreC [Gammaproteobacteria bacterium]MDH3372994.1 rod shape-determining protein MreC [Gammaproteobacteria bacterium]MDH3408136.1 rod shape-determining protein MreC [Gammaproteobacteria bacterium]MDH3553368.1 rod shape-determining protein MreC [Gammaproteobacteria bacterium]